MASTAEARVEWIRAAIDQYQGRLIRFAWRITGDLESARDVVQDTFLRLCREDQDALDDHLAAWLFRVCRNRALDIRKKEGPLQRLDEIDTSALAAPAVDPQDVLEKTEDARRVLAALHDLTPAQQEVLRLRFQEERSYKEISTITHHSVSHVGVLIHTGIKQLRNRLRSAAPLLRTEGVRTDA